MINRIRAKESLRKKKRENLRKTDYKIIFEMIVRLVISQQILDYFDDNV
jgi:hypothetical protein